MKTLKTQLLAKSRNDPSALPPPAVATETGADGPGFRGPHRDGTVRGVRIKSDWNASPPVALWRRPIGPGWSSFAVHGGFYTQEQRGPDEVVACYELATGKPVWAHRDAARFWGSNGGPGPRGTPTLSNGRLYTLGATGILNVLNASDGAGVWSRNAASDAGVKTPGWGFASSPLVVGDMVIVAAAGKLVAYDLAAVTPRWFGPDGGDSYSSPELVAIDETPQIVLNERGRRHCCRTGGRQGTLETLAAI
jgi:outer membrane protein assembly factor BamB